MTTETQTLPSDGIPPWFLEFVQENARQHAELADRINGARAESSEQFAKARAESGEQFAALAVQIAELRGEFRSLKAVGIVIASSGAVLTAAAVTAVARYVLGG